MLVVALEVRHLVLVVQLYIKVAFTDDDVVMLRLMTVQFQKLGVSVREFLSGEEFIKTDWSAAPWDLIVVDHLMPGMSGIQAVLEIAEKKNRSTLVCIASGEAFPSGPDQASIDNVGCPFFLKGKKCCTQILSWYRLRFSVVE